MAPKMPDVLITFSTLAGEVNFSAAGCIAAVSLLLTTLFVASEEQFPRRAAEACLPGHQKRAAGRAGSRALSEIEGRPGVV